MSNQSLVVDFATEKEAGYKRIFSRTPLLSSLSANWEGIYIAYDTFLPGQTPEVCSKQHAIAIFTDLPVPAQAERCLDGKFRRKQVVEGDLEIVPANAWNRSAWNVTGGAIVLAIEPAAFTQTAYETTEECLELIPHTTSDPLVYQIGVALKGALENPRSTSRLYAESLTNALTVHLLQHYSAHTPRILTYRGGMSKPKLRQVVDYIRAHLERDLSLGELAAIASLSSHYFSQLFKQSTGLTPHQYVIHCRIERAKVLLKKNWSISEVATAVGFVDQSHLHRHFKRLVGVTPKVFQSSVINNQ